MFAKYAVYSAFAVSAMAQTFSINTPPSLIQCQPASVSWVGGTSPFVLSALPAGQVSAQAIEFVATGLTASPYVWNVNLAAGNNITLRLSDAGGNPVYASPLVIQNGPSSSCLNASAATSGLSTASVSGTPAVGGSSSSAVSSAMMTSAAMISAAGGVSSSATSAASTATSAASAASAASSAAATATSKAGAFATAVAGAPAIAMAAIGGLVALF